MGASAAHEMAQACRNGKLKSCTCGEFELSETSDAAEDDTSPTPTPSGTTVAVAMGTKLISPTTVPKPAKRREAGCSDNIAYGLQSTKEFQQRHAAFLDPLGSDDIPDTQECANVRRRSLVDIHNEEAGRRVSVVVVNSFEFAASPLPQKQQKQL